MSDMSVIAPGSVAHAALTVLRRQGVRELTTLNLANLLGRNAERLPAQLRQAQFGGFISRRELGNNILWSVGPQAEGNTPSEAEEPARIAVSAQAVPSVFVYAQQRDAAPFSTALHTDGRLDIQRHGRVVCELTNVERLELIQTASVGVTA